MLSFIGIRDNSAAVVEIAPINAMMGTLYSTGFRKRTANIKDAEKHAILPSKLFFVPRSFLFPKGIPIKAAAVSPIARKEITTNAISLGNTAMLIMVEINK